MSSFCNLNCFCLETQACQKKNARLAKRQCPFVNFRKENECEEENTSDIDESKEKELVGSFLMVSKQLSCMQTASAFMPMFTVQAITAF